MHGGAAPDAGRRPTADPAAASWAEAVRPATAGQPAAERRLRRHLTTRGRSASSEQAGRAPPHRRPCSRTASTTSRIWSAIIGSGAASSALPPQASDQVFTPDATASRPPTRSSTSRTPRATARLRPGRVGWRTQRPPPRSVLEHLGVQHLRGDPEAVDEVLRDRAQLAAQRGHLAADRLRPRAGESAVLHEPARSASIVESAKRSQSRFRATLLSLSTMVAGLVTNASSTSRSTWARPAAITWSCTRLNTSTASIPLVHPALQPTGDAGEHVLLAPAEHRELVLRVEQAGLLVPAVVVATGEHVA